MSEWIALGTFVLERDGKRVFGFGPVVKRCKTIEEAQQMIADHNANAKRETV